MELGSPIDRHLVRLLLVTDFLVSTVCRELTNEFVESVALPVKKAYIYRKCCHLSSRFVSGSEMQITLHAKTKSIANRK